MKTHPFPRPMTFGKQNWRSTQVMQGLILQAVALVAAIALAIAIGWFIGRTVQIVGDMASYQKRSGDFYGTTEQYEIFKQKEGIR